MQSQLYRLPERFPVGTRYVVEARNSVRGSLRVRSRYVEFPDGRHVDLPAGGSHPRRPERRARQNKFALPWNGSR
jgi:hypothetical protein